MNENVEMVRHESGFGHSKGLCCDECPPDIWPKWSNRTISALYEDIKGLPEANAAKGRDYGRGYSQGVKDALEVLRRLNGMPG